MLFCFKILHEDIYLDYWWLFFSILLNLARQTRKCLILSPLFAVLATVSRKCSVFRPTKGGLSFLFFFLFFFCFVLLFLFLLLCWCWRCFACLLFTFVFTLGPRFSHKKLPCFRSGGSNGMTLEITLLVYWFACFFPVLTPHSSIPWKNKFHQNRSLVHPVDFLSFFLVLNDYALNGCVRDVRHNF